MFKNCFYYIIEDKHSITRCKIYSNKLYNNNNNCKFMVNKITDKQNF